MSMALRAALVALFCVHHSTAGPSFPGPAQYFGHAALHAAVLCADVAPRAQARRGRAVTLGPDSNRRAASPTAEASPGRSASLLENVEEGARCFRWTPSTPKGEGEEVDTTTLFTGEAIKYPMMIFEKLGEESYSTAVLVSGIYNGCDAVQAVLIILKPGVLDAGSQAYPKQTYILNMYNKKLFWFFLLPRDLKSPRTPELCRKKKWWEWGHECKEIQQSVYPLMDGTLDEWRKNATTEEFDLCFDRIAYSLALGLYDLHAVGLAHTDVAKENVLYQQTDWVLYKQQTGKCPVMNISHLGALCELKDSCSDKLPYGKRQLWDYHSNTTNASSTLRVSARIQDWRALFTVLYSMLNNVEYSFNVAADDFHTKGSKSSTVVIKLAEVLPSSDNLKACKNLELDDASRENCFKESGGDGKNFMFEMQSFLQSHCQNFFAVNACDDLGPQHFLA